MPHPHRVGQLQLQLRSRRRAQALGQGAGGRGLLLPTGFRADPRSWARLRKRVFRDPPRQRNRVWQMDFSEFETAGGGIWRICAVIDYATEYCLAARITPTSRGQDALGCLRRAVVEAERVLDLDDLRADCGVMEVVDADDYVIGEAPAPTPS
jgi:putative transposase